MIIPDGHDERHTRAHSRRHGCHPTLGLEAIVIAKSSLLSVAVCGGDGIVVRGACDGGVGVGDDDSVLDVEALDFREGAANELRHDCEDLGGVHCQTLAVECRVALPVAVEITAVGIADAGIASAGVCTSTGVAITHCLTNGRTGVRGQSSGY